MVSTIAFVTVSVSPQESIATLATAMRAELTLLLSAFAAVITWQLLTGRINTSGLLSPAGESGASGNNVQLLFMTLAAAGYYLLQIPQYLPQHQMPPVPNELLVFIAGSHTVFTGARALPFIGSLLTKERN